MQCVTCEHELIAGKRFCAECGTEVGRRCPTCGANVESRFRFCPDCGTRLEGGPAGEASRATAQMPNDLAGVAETPYVPAWEGMQKQRGEHPTLEERKIVTVLFCDLVGSTAIADTLDPEEYRDLLDEYMQLAFREIYAVEGVVNVLAGDGFMALFGAPIAHEDAPHRAVRAALAIREALAGFNTGRSAGARELQVRIGIHTGSVVVGTVGNDLKMDYTAVGDTTNLASRLQTAARPGSILISHATHRLVRDAFVTELAGPFEVKGKREPVVAYEVRAASEATTPMAIAEARGMTPYVGRGAELAQLTASYARAREHAAQVLTIVGDAGSGKSRLIYEFNQHIAPDDVAHFEARCSELTQGIPYAPMVAMMRQYFGLVPGDPPASACGKVTARLAELADAPENLHAHLCRFLTVHDAGPAGVPAEELRQETFEAVSKLVYLTSQRRPVLMILEDLHWMDDASREMISLAVTRMHSAAVMLIVSHRPDYQPAWRATAALTQLTLPPLPDTEVSAILRAVAGGRLPTALESKILDKAEGNPFFAEEITRGLVEEGFLLRGDGHVRLTRPVSEIGIPDTVHELIGARLDRLAPQTKRVAQVAAVLGRQFHRGQLTRLLEGEDVDVGRELERLEQRGIIHRKHVLTRDEYRFGESLAQEVAYEALLLKDRRQLHERIGMLLEREGGDGPERIALLAHHFARSDNRLKAIEALLRAARGAEALPSYSNAVAFYRQAWDLADPALEESGGTDATLKKAVLDATFGLVRVAVLYGPSPVQDTERAARRGRALAEELHDVETLAGLCTFHGLVLVSGDRERFAEGLALAEEGLVIAQRAHLDLSATSISRGLAWTYVIDGQFELARRTIDWVVQDLETRGLRPAVNDIYFGARWVREGVLCLSDDLAGAEESALQTYELAIADGNRTSQSGASATLAQVYFERAEYREALRWAERSLEISQSIGSLAGIRTAAAVTLGSRLELGEPANVASYLDAIEDGLAQGGTLPVNSRVILEALLLVGELERARRIAEIAYSRGGGRLREAIMASVFGDIMLRLGPAHWLEADRWYAQAIGLAQVIGARSTEVAAHLGVAELAIARGDRESAARHVQLALIHTRELGLRRLHARAERLLAEVSVETKQLA